MSFAYGSDKADIHFVGLAHLKENCYGVFVAPPPPPEMISRCMRFAISLAPVQKKKESTSAAHFLRLWFLSVFLICALGMDHLNKSTLEGSMWFVGLLAKYDFMCILYITPHFGKPPPPKRQTNIARIGHVPAHSRCSSRRNFP